MRFVINIRWIMQKEDIKKILIKNGFGGVKNLPIDTFFNYSDAKKKELIQEKKLYFKDEYGGIIDIREIKKLLFNEVTKDSSRAETSVFISYSTEDEDEALKLKYGLEEKGIRTIMDSEHLGHEFEIKEYLEKFIKQTDYTLCLISEKSLLSGWVGFEIITVMNIGREIRKQKFIGCAIDDSWKYPLFEWVPKIDKEINRLQDKLNKELQLYPNSEELLGKDLSRMRQFRKNADKIFYQLRQFRTEDFSKENWDNGVKKILKTIKS